MQNIRNIPPVCLFISLIHLLTGRLVFPRRYLNQHIRTKNMGIYTIFRHVALTGSKDGSENCVFLVSFKFSNLSFPANKFASLIPMLIIAGSPGFMQKVYGADPESGYWQGLYQWRSPMDLETYRKSFIFLMMNKRAVRVLYQPK